MKNVEKKVLLGLKNITKEYYGVPALNNVSFDIYEGEIHGLIGENGAGKSTLIKSIAGAINLSKGEIYFDGKKLEVQHPIDAINEGIGVVYQEFNLFPNLTVYENIFFGIEHKHQTKFLDRNKMINESIQLISELGFSFDVTQPVKLLSTAFQQVVEIAKCINHKIKLIIMDEPSAPLTENEVGDMFKVVRRLNEKGVTVIYISHKLNEILELTDRITVLRDGQYITTIDTLGATENDLISYMVGRNIKDIYPSKEISKGQTILECKNISGGKVKNASFQLKQGEVLGFGGLVGAGRTELMRLVFGADSMETGEILIKNKKVKIKSPTDAIENGIGLIPEDRKLHGLILNKSIYLNCLLPSLKKYSKKPLSFIDFKKSKVDIDKYYQQLKIKARNQEQVVLNLSGGNQQKVVLEKWLLRDCDILILDEPTRGIDVGAKQEIYSLIKELALKHKAIIVISSDMAELIGVSHRILVMHEGSISGELQGVRINQEAIMELAS